MSVFPALARAAAGLALLVPVTTTRAQAPAQQTSRPQRLAATSSGASVPHVPALNTADPGAVGPRGGDAPATRSVPVTAPARATPSATGAPRSPSVVSARNARLTERERRAVGLSQRWMGGRDMPAAGADGRVVFTFGATLPSVVCAPLYVCDIALQPGEIVNDINLADPVRWTLAPSASGSGVLKTTHLVLKPTDAGLTTNMLVTTDRRAYVIKLVSRQTEWMPFVSFVYPDEVSAQWSVYRAQQDVERARERAATVLPTGERGEASVAALDFDFRIEGDRPRWRPVRVYTDRVKTYVQFPAAMATGEAPAFVALDQDGRERLVNYRTVGDRYVIDRVIDRAVLVTGVGRRQQRVEIVRDASQGGR